LLVEFREPGQHVNRYEPLQPRRVRTLRDRVEAARPLLGSEDYGARRRAGTGPAVRFLAARAAGREDECQGGQDHDEAHEGVARVLHETSWVHIPGHSWASYLNGRDSPGMRGTYG